MKNPDQEVPQAVFDALESMAERKPKAAAALREFSCILLLARTEWMNGQHPDFSSALAAVAARSPL